MICVVEMKLGELILLNGIEHETIDIQLQYTVSILTSAWTKAILLCP